MHIRHDTMCHPAILIQYDGILLIGITCSRSPSRKMPSSPTNGFNESSRIARITARNVCVTGIEYCDAERLGKPFAVRMFFSRQHWILPSLFSAKSCENNNDKQKFVCLRLLAISSELIGNWQSSNISIRLLVWLCSADFRPVPVFVYCEHFHFSYNTFPYSVECAVCALIIFI